jgi:hypothetical protein
MKQFYDTLKLQGATADAAVDCMRREGVMPSKPAFAGPQHQTVDLNQDGQIVIRKSDGDSNPRTGHEAGSFMRPEGYTTKHGSYMSNDPSNYDVQTTGRAAVSTLEVEATGPAAETMRQKAVACAVKSLGFKP